MREKIVPSALKAKYIQHKNIEQKNKYKSRYNSKISNFMMNNWCRHRFPFGLCFVVELIFPSSSIRHIKNIPSTILSRFFSQAITTFLLYMVKDKFGFIWQIKKTPSFTDITTKWIYFGVLDQHALLAAIGEINTKTFDRGLILVYNEKTKTKKVAKLKSSWKNLSKRYLIY